MSCAISDQTGIISGMVAAVATVLEVLVVVGHVGFLVLLVTGGFAALRHRAVLPWHLGAVAWAVLSVALRWDCPLTDLQQALRALAGRPSLPGGFIDTYVSGTLVPAGADAAVQAVVAAVVLGSWLLLARDARRRRPGHRRRTSPPIA